MRKNYIPAFNFDFLTPFYDLLLELIGYGYTQRIKVVKLLKLRGGEKLLDVGCGTGTLLQVAKQLHPEVNMFGVDIDNNVLSLARKKVNKNKLQIAFTQASANNLPFKDRTFDIVVSTLIFHHLPTQVKIQAISEIYRVLKPKGRFLLADFGRNNSFSIKLWSALAHLIKLPEAITIEDNLSGFIPNYLEKAGFKIMEVAPVYKGIQFLLCTK
ncbi:hypothetical protein A2631_04755 [Candidatus Daviesbacteria bacterium RIFCSPHIGHO2_01_FULL_44_29]|uniref:Methyltransferase domain-containing protein n=1 Tax=Candidatus Daviesbacteria bacterium RIFCSPHIGHO2_02_FULL_43_12 TaxID=1797776 RepID=A0A1F5KHE3_9BACT|nr:MAG: hypothetical protein A2631_04755 [Candidatus Daviesbacteria bacterium RIFCSPHIGHO2_01_FULL_44_29]OGE40031.1 MAG: hypothetical protein A3D25_04485 [Candidatus Daviesbacteria bacterium RIFCSPHIGHO2_02_FULL_43_12]OGE41487.1 MAG: hypothetical protein A3E86_05325 [Candidatus Daviesbacteria bacterium RIFCSPHIGHO2_12_FULL_47_45]OGE70288.1 MAG: hypothetical protein A3B55_01085 [Candidatus Daviesbacteria bacterium RIFCSPLOWO2_01_FULL_43_15]